MEYRQLGQTTINISTIGLVTLTWVEQTTQVTAIEQTHKAQPNPAP